MTRVPLVLAFVLAGCGPASTFTGSCNVGGIGICSDYDSQAADDAANIKMSCAVLGGTWALTACGHVAIVGGCKVNRTDSGTQTSWYAPSSGFTADNVMTQCASKGGTF